MKGATMEPARGWTRRKYHVQHDTGGHFETIHGQAYETLEEAITAARALAATGDYQDPHTQLRVVDWMAYWAAIHYLEREP